MLAVALGGIAASLARADFININPVKDNTLYEYVPADGDRSNGIGDHFFAGKTGMGFIRRGVLAFDIAGNVPPGSTITSVSLTMHMSRTALSNVRTVELHTLLADWGEGTSDATANEGQGAQPLHSHCQRRHLAASFLQYHFLDDARRRFFRHCERKPVGRRHWRLYLEFDADD